MAITINQILDGFEQRDVSILARAITLVESEKLEHRELTQQLFSHLQIKRTIKKPLKIAVSGTPGVGKSSFIEKFGLHIVDKLNLNLAVLAIDPSSQISGGSILGDKTRMNELSRHARAFIRPSAAGNHLGGVARKTRDVIALCEFFGFDYILVETVGVGQSEAAAWSMVDIFMMLMQTGGGDDLQGIKRGILELVDLMIITKADGENLAKANIYAQEMKMALNLLRGKEIDVLTCSSLKNVGFKDVYKKLIHFQKVQKSSSSVELAKKEYWAREYLFDEISARLLPEIYRHIQSDSSKSPEEIVQLYLNKLIK
jgi:LAO/AO transport system kinase